MAASSTSVVTRFPAYVCTSCRSSRGAWQSARFVAVRTICTLPSSRSRRAPQRALQPSRPYPQISRPLAVGRASLPRVRSACSYSTTNDASQPTKSGITPLSHRRLLFLSGPDTVKFLQGLITNNVHAHRDQPFFAAFLDSRGRVLWDVFVWVYPELLANEDHWSCYVEVDASEIEALRKHLKRHKLRSKVSIELVPEEELGVWAAWGQAYNSVNAQAVIADMCDPRGDMSTLWRILAKPDSSLISGGSEIQDIQQYHLQRYKQGIAEGPHEIARESALPMEVNIDLAQGIDFKKGCYVGQELTIRTKHTGVVRKRLLPVQLDFSGIPLSSSLQLESGADIKQLDETGAIKKGRATGKFVTCIGNIGLALCRLEMMTPMSVSAEGGSYRDGMEFGVTVRESEHVVKVKPLLHPWFVDKEQQLWAKSKSKSMAEQHLE
ncbi:aminomethyltransferase [Ascochyta rabiei]|uniref:Iron-sulfur cluster assembly factor IBA57 homolog, mitochondrial n=1 Tax=Didymella rabiei TaxID=5454 RepID=A0A163G8S5_DIDRA|nr:aminomethyltransferase [Ascochyta rabiei]